MAATSINLPHYDYDTKNYFVFYIGGGDYYVTKSVYNQKNLRVINADTSNEAYNTF